MQVSRAEYDAFVREAISMIKEAAKIILSCGMSNRLHMRLKYTGWAASLFGEFLQREIVKRRRSESAQPGDIVGDPASLLAFRKKWP